MQTNVTDVEGFQKINRKVALVWNVNMS